MQLFFHMIQYKIIIADHMENFSKKSLQSPRGITESN